MHAFTVNYKRRDNSRELVNLGFFLSSLRRPLILCRLFGHRPVVDGTEGFRDQPGYRWVTCDRCAVRPDPQGRLSAADWNVGQPYTGEWSAPLPADWREQTKTLNGLKLAPQYPPGPWPTDATGGLGGQLLVGHRWGRIGFELKVGNKGSEHTLAASVHLWFLGALYLHTERFGSWLVRRLNPTGYNSKVIGLSLDGKYLTWKLWAERDGGSSPRDPWRKKIRHNSINIDLRDKLLGPRRYSYDDTGDPVTAAVHMPQGDDHEVTLQLQRQTLGRRRGRKRRSWNVDWECAAGIPTRPDNRGRVMGSGVSVSDAAVANGVWIIEATSAIAAQMTVDRRRNDWEPETAGAR